MIMLWFYWKCPLPRPSCQFCCSICFDKVCRIWCFLFDYTILYWQIKYIFQDFCCWFLRIRKIVWGRGVGRDIFSIGGMGGSSALIKVVVLNTSQQWPLIPRTMSNKIEIRFSYTIWLFWSYYRRNFSEKISGDFFKISRWLPSYLFLWTTFQKVSYYHEKNKINTPLGEF